MAPDLPLHNAYKEIMSALDRSAERARLPYPPQLLEAIKKARYQKFVNKQREIQRERRGEVLNSTLRRRNKGPPAHVLQQMTPAERKADRVVRSVSEVGYVGMLKRRLGWRLKDPEAWKVEIGRPEDKERLDQMWKDVRQENIRRRNACRDA